jgi:hypothetical protein
MNRPAGAMGVTAEIVILAFMPKIDDPFSG